MGDLNERKEIAADLRYHWPTQVECIVAADQLDAAADELARLRAEVVDLARRYADSESKLAFCDAALQDMQARAECAEARVREAPVVEAEPFRETGSAGSYPYAAIALTGETAKRIGGKRVALVLLDTDD